MLSLATVILANALMNGDIPLNYEHRDYKLQQAEIFLRNRKIYDLSNLMGKAVYETKYSLKVLDVIAVYGLPASVLHKQE
ncbi:hypothetical protein AYJ00_13700 [Shewanella algae]|uniref:hypothetical protein n=1 Tax=Shewanella algae TaxID=38313 RepID=UPI00118229A9|nr:hypothetical protein [Shewanella algae]TVL58815.1 hypothetical protein AYJ00_13700 [Shewanella algae]